MMALLSLKILETEYSIYQFSEKHQVPDTIFDSEFLSVSYAVDEITVICQSNLEVNSKVGDGNWTCLQLVGEFDLGIKGVWAKITSIVAEAGSPVLAITTYNTDYFLVKTESLKAVKELFKKKNFQFI